MRSYPKGKPAAHGIFNSLPRSHPRGESNWKLERISLERLFVYFLRVVLRLNFNEHSPRGPCIIHGLSLLNYCGICLAKSFYHSRKTRCLRYVDLMQTSISYTQLEVTVLSRDLPAFASPYCDKKSTNSNLVLCFSPTCATQMNYTKPRTYYVGMLWSLAALHKRRLSEIDLSGEQYKSIFWLAIY